MSYLSNLIKALRMARLIPRECMRGRKGDTGEVGEPSYTGFVTSWTNGCMGVSYEVFTTDGVQVTNAEQQANGDYQAASEETVNAGDGDEFNVDVTLSNETGADVWMGWADTANCIGGTSSIGNKLVSGRQQISISIAGVRPDCRVAIATFGISTFTLTFHEITHIPA